MLSKHRILSKFVITLLLLGLVALFAIDTAPAQAATSLTFSGASITTSNTFYGFCNGDPSKPIYGIAHEFHVDTTGTYQFINPSYTSGDFMWVSTHTSASPSNIFNDRLMGMWVYPNLSSGNQTGVLTAGQTYYVIVSGDITGGCFYSPSAYPVSNYSVTISGPGNIGNGPAPTVTITPPTSTTINEGTTTTFTIGLSPAPTSQVDVQMSVNDGSQCNINGVANTTYYLADGNTQTVTINGVADGIYDTNFTCTITIQNAIQSGGSGEFNGITPSLTTFNVTVNNTDPVPTITITPPISTTIDEGTTTTFTMGLNPAPVSGLVEIIISSSDNTECRLNGQTTTTMYFDNANPSQTVTVSGEADATIDGNEACNISISNAVHLGGQFDGVVPSQSSIAMTINNTDMPPPTVTITGPVSTTVNEGVSASFTVNLSEAPTATVNMTIGSDTPGECMPNPFALSINAGVQTANVDIMTFTDNTVDGNRTCNITISNTSGDPRYAGITPSVTGFAMTVVDVDTAGVTVGAPVSVTVAEGGNTTFNVNLTANPVSNVTIPITVSDPSECSVNPTSLVLGNTNVATVTINGLNDNTVDGAQNCTAQLGTATGPGGYNAFDANDVTVSITDVDVAGTNETTAPTQIAENTNTTATFNLTSIPTATVTATVSTSTPDECSVTPGTLTITDMSAQSVTITGVDDLMADGTQTCNISVSFAGATEYVAVTYTAGINVTDNNTASIAIAPNTPANIAEGGTQAYTFTLGSLPTAPMSFTVSTANAQCSVAPATVTLNNTNWNTGASVTVTGTAETITDGNQGCDLITAAATGAPEYAGMNPPDATITITDDDTASYATATAVVGLLEGDSGTATVNLTTAPDADVNFTFSTADTNVCVISGATTHTFNGSNYNTPFTVTFQAPTDGITDGNQTCTVQFGVATTATGYNGLANPANMTFTVTDIDSPNLNVTPFTPTTILEGASASYTVALTTQPDADVTLNFVSADPAVCTVTSAASHTFTNVTFGNAFTVTADAIDNDLVDGTRTCTIQTTIVSTATGYSTLTVADNSVDVADNDTPGIVINLGDDGDDDVFTQVISAVLQTQPAPGEVVMIDFSNLPPEIVVTPNPYIFDETNWNIPVTISIVIDENFSGDINEALTLTIDSNSPDYGSLPPLNLSAMNIVIELVAPPPPPSLNDWMGEEGSETRGNAYGMPNNAYGTIHMWQGAWQYNPGGVPQELIDYGVIFAVDVWMLTQDGQPQFDFGEGYEAICLQGIGRMIFFDATTSPRQMTEILPVTFEDGYTCGWIPNAGTVVLIDPE